MSGKSYLGEFQRWHSNQSDYSPSISFQLTKTNKSMSRIILLLAVVKYRINDVVKEEPRLVAVTATTDDTERDLIMKAHNAVVKTFEQYYPKGSMLLSLLVMETIDGTDSAKSVEPSVPESLPESSGPEKSIGGATADGLTVDGLDPVMAADGPDSESSGESVEEGQGGETEPKDDPKE